MSAHSLEAALRELDRLNGKICHLEREKKQLENTLSHERQFYVAQWKKTRKAVEQLETIIEEIKKGFLVE